MTKKDTTLSMLQAAAERGRGVTNREFVRADVFRYSARIAELRDEGYTIDTVPLKRGLFEFRLVMFTPSGDGGNAGKKEESGDEQGPAPEPLFDLPKPQMFACDLNDSPYY
jgi:hypothetical protein